MLGQIERTEHFSPSESARCGPAAAPRTQPIPSLTALVASMSHDLRTPLAAILANAEFLAQSHLSKKERDELYEEIRFSIDRMNELISDLMETSTGREGFCRSIGNIVETISRVMRMIGVRRAFRRITITHRHEGLAIGSYNSGLVERALSNIVLNACEAVSSECGEVAITTRGGPACLHIEIWDNGPGIPAEIRDFLFQPFFTYGKLAGTGMGLAIAKRIVEEHGGQLFLDAGEKIGTSFKIWIPFANPEQART